MGMYEITICGLLVAGFLCISHAVAYAIGRSHGIDEAGRFMIHRAQEGLNDQDR